VPVAVVARGIELCIAGLFAVAAAHKTIVMVRGEAHMDPIVWVSPFRRFPRIGLALGAAVEVLVVVALAAAPQIGLVAAFLVLCAYTALLARLPASERCSCFGALLPDGSKRTALLRNLGLLLVVAGLVLARGLGEVTSGLPAESVAFLVIPAAAVLSALAFRSLFTPTDMKEMRS
jgi:hypothetical protein